MFTPIKPLWHKGLRHFSVCEVTLIPYKSIRFTRKLFYIILFTLKYSIGKTFTSHFIETPRIPYRTRAYRVFSGCEHLQMSFLILLFQSILLDEFLHERCLYQLLPYEYVVGNL